MMRSVKGTQHMKMPRRKMPGHRAMPVRALLKPVMAAIKRTRESGETLTGVPTGFRDLDRITGGLRSGEAIVIAARPCMGKTSLAMNIAMNVAIQHKLPVGVFSLELSAEDFVRRMLCSLAKVSLRSLHDGSLGKREHCQLTAAAGELSRATLLVDDTTGLTTDQLQVRARRMKRDHDVRLLVLDNLQLMRGGADVGLDIKAFARELNMPMIVLSALLRSAEEREGGRPKLSDLRTSSLIEQCADVVGLLVRMEIYAENEVERVAAKGKASLIIAKNHNGPTGDVELKFHSEYMRYENLSEPV
jgi:replicative DNA helicase